MCKWDTSAVKLPVPRCLCDVETVARLCRVTILGKWAYKGSILNVKCRIEKP